MTIVIFGSINLDLTAYVSNLPLPGQTVHADRHVIALGGKGANQAVAVKLFSTDKVLFVAAIGNDIFGKKVQSELESFGLDLDELVVVNEPTGIALINVDMEGQNTISVVGGANMSWSNSGPDPKIFENSSVALFQLEVPLAAVRSAMIAARSHGAYVILDPAPAAKGAAIQELLSLADAVTPNESECEAIIGWRPDSLAQAEQAAQELVKLGVGFAIVKLGSCGLAYACANGQSGSLAPFVVKACDSVSAGDAFCGALAVAISEKMELIDTLRFASAAGALTATKMGAAGSIPSRVELQEILSQP